MERYTIQTKVNLINGKNNDTVIGNNDNAQINANMRVVHNLLGDDTQEESKYSLSQKALCAA